MLVVDGTGSRVGVKQPEQGILWWPFTFQTGWTGVAPGAAVSTAILGLTRPLAQ